jgi:hypothetical protein
MDDDTLNSDVDYLDELRRTNHERLERLAVDGYVLDPLEQLQHRLDLLTTSTIGGLAALGARDPHELERAFEETWEEGCAERIAELEAARNTDKLTAGNGHEQLTIADGLIL